jgi:hypothetical protein
LRRAVPAFEEFLAELQGAEVAQKSQTKIKENKGISFGFPSATSA